MMMWCDSTVTLAAGVVPNITVAPLTNFASQYVDRRAPGHGTHLGEDPLDSGERAPVDPVGVSNVNASLDVGMLEPTADVTMMSTVPAGSAGDLARMTWFDSKITLAAGSGPKATVAVLVKCWPLMSTRVPPATPAVIREHPLHDRSIEIEGEGISGRGSARSGCRRDDDVHRAGGFGGRLGDEEVLGLHRHLGGRCRPEGHGGIGGETGARNGDVGAAGCRTLVAEHGRHRRGRSGWRWRPPTTPRARGRRRELPRKDQTEPSAHDDPVSGTATPVWRVRLLIAPATRFVTCSCDVSPSVVWNPPRGLE